MGKLNEEFREIAVLVISQGKQRLFTTNRFTIRGLVIHLQRHNPHFYIKEIGYMNDKVTISNREWTDYHSDVPSGIEPFTDENSYRELLNMTYANNANMGLYPSKNPFRCKKLTKNTHPITSKIGEIKFLTYVDDNFLIDNGMEPSDILMYFDGKRITRTHNSITKHGYILTNNRENYREND